MPSAGRAIRRLVRTVTLGAGVLVAAAFPAGAGDTQLTLVPEINAYLKLNDTMRLFFLGDVTANATTGSTDGEVGAHLDITLAPILRYELRDANWERNRYLWIRVGYRLLGSLDDPVAVTENRGVLEVTGRAPLPWHLWLVNRLRLDLRDLEGDFSTRFRYRLGIEREFKLAETTLVPYAQAEVFYDTRFGAWNRQRYQAGVEIELTEHVRIEPYYYRQEDQRSSPAHLDQVGVVLKLFF